MRKINGNESMKNFRNSLLLHKAVLFGLLFVGSPANEQKLYHHWSNIFRYIRGNSLTHTLINPIDKWPEGITENHSDLQGSISSLSSSLARGHLIDVIAKFVESITVWHLAWWVQLSVEAAPGPNKTIVCKKKSISGLPIIALMTHSSFRILTISSLLVRDTVQQRSSD